ncbi:MAG: hypothetical protein J5786_02380 [Clostridiales bacterium]|nr:hypothetical protein [Clostridiales bacterium]
MAISIIVYEKDEYTYRLIRQRLKRHFSNAYIHLAGKDLRDDYSDFADCTKLLYNNKQFDPSEFPEDSVPLYNRYGYIDMKYISECLSEGIKTDEKTSVTLLLPFVYSKERERFIDEDLSGRMNTELKIRLDLLPRYKMPADAGIKSGDLSKLIRRSKDRRFRPEDILKYCTPDSRGFITPGPAEDDADIYSEDITGILRLLELLEELVKHGELDVSALLNCENFRTDQIFRIAGFADNIIVLLPNRSSGLNPSMNALINQLSGSGKTVEVCYVNDDEEDNYDEAI